MSIRILKWLNGNELLIVRNVSEPVESIMVCQASLPILPATSLVPKTLMTLEKTHITTPSLKCWVIGRLEIISKFIKPFIPHERSA